MDGLHGVAGGCHFSLLQLVGNVGQPCIEGFKPRQRINTARDGGFGAADQRLQTADDGIGDSGWLGFGSGKVFDLIGQLIQPGDQRFINATCVKRFDLTGDVAEIVSQFRHAIFTRAILDKCLQICNPCVQPGDGFFVSQLSHARGKVLNAAADLGFHRSRFELIDLLCERCQPGLKALERRIVGGGRG